MFGGAWREWARDDVPRLSASLAFYLILALSPLLLFLVGFIGLLPQTSSFQGAFLASIRDTIGQDQQQFIQTLMPQPGAHPATGIAATVIGLTLSLFGASGVFQQLRLAANTVWDVKSAGGLKVALVARLGSLLMVFFGVAIAVAWVSFDTWLLFLRHRAQAESASVGLREVFWPAWRLVSFVISWAFWAPIHAAIFRYLPKVKVEMRDVWTAAILTALALAVAKLVLSDYFLYSRSSAAYGSAGALVVILLWVYYSAQIFFFGMEFSKVYAKTYGSMSSTDGGRPA